MNLSASEAVDLVTVDPGLPNPSPTSSYWMQPPSWLAELRSNAPPARSDVVVIGSGITGAAVARTVLQNHPMMQVCILEARSVCSGATGRNGGHLVAYGGAIYSRLKQALGRNRASRVLAFTFDNIKKTRELIKEYSSNEGFREVTRYRSFGDETTYQEARESVAEFEADNPMWAGSYRFVDKETAAKEYGVHDVAGLCIFTAGALSPYRLITTIYERLLEAYAPARFSIEAHTPVLGVEHDASGSCTHPYLIMTPRGIVRAAHVIYCTNGYTGHLLPKLRGSLYPFRGCMTVQDLNHRLPNRGDSVSWSLHHQPRPCTQSDKTAVGTLYMQQDPSTGLFYLGGGKGSAQEIVNSDDSEAPAHNIQYLRDELPKLFGLQPENTDLLVSQWSGIMGFTADGLPLVGRLPEIITGRQGLGEWVAAGFNGMGMSLCVASGEAVGRMVIGKESDESVPEALRITPSRWSDMLGANVAADKIRAIFTMPSRPTKERL